MTTHRVRFPSPTLITSTHDSSNANLKCRHTHTLSLSVFLLLSLPFLGSCPLSYFLYPLLRAPSNLSVLFYLPEGECFWITGLINTVNTDHQPLTQHCADRGEKQRRSWGLSAMESKLCVWVRLPKHCTVQAVRFWAAQSYSQRPWEECGEMCLNRWHCERCTVRQQLERIIQEYLKVKMFFLFRLEGWAKKPGGVRADESKTVSSSRRIIQYSCTRCTQLK